MSVNAGPHGTLVVAAQVNSVQITGGTILSQGDVSEVGFQTRFQHDLGGCGGPDSGIFVEIKDFIPWTFMSAQFLLMGSASCWSFNTSGYGSAVGNGGTGNMIYYDATLGDSCIRTYLAQGDPAFITHSIFNACDNDANNFMRFNTGVYRSCTFVRRRNVNGSLAGVHHGRSCNASGSGAITIIQNIYVW
jgi:hypothetical protein